MELLLGILFAFPDHCGHFSRQLMYAHYQNNAWFCSSEVSVYAYAAAQVKKAMEVSVNGIT